MLEQRKGRDSVAAEGIKGMSGVLERLTDYEEASKERSCRWPS